jgi:hypothetical protein
VRRARNPILEPDEEFHNTRRNYPERFTKEGALFEGCHRAKPTVPADAAGLLSVRHAEMLFAELPPHKARSAGMTGCAGLDSARYTELLRSGKMRPSTNADLGTFHARNPLQGSSEEEVIGFRRGKPANVAHLQDQFGSDLVGTKPDADEASRRSRRPATAVPPDGEVGKMAGVSTQHLHHRGTIAKVIPPPSQMSGVINYTYAGRNSVPLTSPIGSARASERSRYEAKLAAFHMERSEEVAASRARRTS